MNAQVRLFQKLDKSLDSIDYNDNSVYTGTTGIALFYWKLFSLTGNRAYIEKSHQLVRSALDRRKGKRVTFACGDAGPLALGAVIYEQMGRREKAQKYVDELYGKSSWVRKLDIDLPDEFLYGRVGYLFSLLFVAKHVGAWTVQHEVIHSVIDTILESGKRLAREERSQAPLMYQWHDRHYVGAAHGLNGILAIIMQTSFMFPDDKILRDKIDKDVRPTLDYVIAQRYRSGNFPSSLETFRIYGESKYMEAAVQCGEVVWRRGLLKKGYGICHGVAGNAYTFITLFNVTKELKHAYRASMFAKWIFDYGTHGCRVADRPFSLFEGLAGTLYFLYDMNNIENARYPAYDLL